jgi:hypothetical protein
MIEHVFAKSDFPAQTASGARLVVRKGSHWPANDPVVEQHPDAFTADPRYGMQYSEEPAGWDAPPIESATAGPGERRNTRRQQS